MFGSLRRRLRGERRLWVVHSAPFQNPQRAVGKVVDWEGHFFLVTRWIERPPVRLDRGGSAPTWEVWGRPVSAEELRRRSEAR